MDKAQTETKEHLRLEALHALKILDTKAEERFDRITRLAQRMFDVPIALISLVDEKRQWFKSRCGLDVQETSREIAFCHYTIQQTTALVVENATKDPRFCKNPLVTGESHFRFYAGYPIHDPDGNVLGTFCIIDRKPRSLPEQDQLALGDFAKLVETQIEKTALASTAYLQQQELIATAARLGTHVENSPLGVVEFDASNAIRHWSRRCESLLGWTTAEASGPHFPPLFWVDVQDRPIVTQALERLHTGAESSTICQVRALAKDGSLVSCRLHSSAIATTNAEEPSILTLVQDVTSEVESAIRLQQNEQQFRETFELAAIGVAHVGLNGEWLNVNQALCDFLGYSYEELSRLTFQDITFPDDLAADLDNVRDLLAGEINSYSMEKRYIRRSGTYQWARLTVSLRRDKTGEPLHFISLIEDIETRKAAELALHQIRNHLESLVQDRTNALKDSNRNLAFEVEQRRNAEEKAATSEERIRLILQNSHEAFIGIDAEGRVTDWNAQSEATFGWTFTEAVGKSLTDLIVPPELRLAHQKGLKRYLSSGEATVINKRLELPALCKSGERILVELTIGVSMVEGKYHFGAFLHDISERKRLQDELEAQQELLNAVLDSIDVGVVACDQDGQLTLFNRAARDLHGLPPAVMNMEEWSRHYHLYAPDEKTILQTEQVPLWRALKGEHVKNLEMVIAPEGRPSRFLHASGRRIVGQSGRQLGAVVAMKDVTDLKATEKRLSLNEKRLRAITENIPAMIGHVDQYETLLFLNTQAEKQVFEGDMGGLIGKPLAIAYGERRYEQIKPYVDRVLSGEKVYFERDIFIGGERRHYHTVYVPSVDETDAVNGFYAMAMDITDRKNSELRQAESEERLKVITDNLPILIAYIDKEERYRFANGQYELWFGVPPREMIGRTVLEVLGPATYELGREQLRRNLSGEIVRFETTALIREELRFVEVAGFPHFLDGQVCGVYVMTTDITKIKKQEQQLQLLARTDPLTGLPNRRRYEEKLQEAALRSVRNQSMVALLYLDVDHFKQINDTYGHEGGDEVLKEFALRLKNAVRATDTVSRIAGDEFTILLEGINSPPEAEVVAKKVLEAIEAPFLTQGKISKISTSIGVMCMNPHNVDLSRLTKGADDALYAAKAAGRNRYHLSDG